MIVLLVDPYGWRYFTIKVPILGMENTRKKNNTLLEKASGI